jgi:hypothetical protein
LNSPQPFEHGSFFHLDLSMGGAHAPWTPVEASWFGTARDALRAIVQESSGPRIRRLLLPTYYCHDVTGALRHSLDIGFYPDGPRDEPHTLKLCDDEGAIAVDYFGAPHQLEVVGGTLIRDATHDPLLSHPGERPADFVIASLRKTLPVPDGALVWSESGRTPPASPLPTREHLAAVARLTTGMMLKLAYLQGFAVEKDAFLEPLRSGEAALGAGVALSGVSELTRHLATAMDVPSWLGRRRQNHRTFTEVFGPSREGFRLLEHPAFAVIVSPRHGARDRARQALIRSGIYPAILWEQPRATTPRHQLDLADRILVLHVDGRYSPEETGRMARAVRAVAHQVGDADEG